MRPTAFNKHVFRNFGDIRQHVNFHGRDNFLVRRIFIQGMLH